MEANRLVSSPTPSQSYSSGNMNNERAQSREGISIASPSVDGITPMALPTISNNDGVGISLVSEQLNSNGRDDIQPKMVPGSYSICMDQPTSLNYSECNGTAQQTEDRESEDAAEPRAKKRPNATAESASTQSQLDAPAKRSRKSTSVIESDSNYEPDSDHNINNNSPAVGPLLVPIEIKSTPKKQVQQRKQPSPKQRSKQGGQRRQSSQQPRLNQKFKVMREIKFLKETTHLLIPRAPFVRLVRETMRHTEIHREHNITPAAVDALHQSAELYLVQLLEDSNRCAGHRGRVTVSVKDMRFMLKLRGPNDPGL